MTLTLHRTKNATEPCLTVMVVTLDLWCHFSQATEWVSSHTLPVRRLTDITKSPHWELYTSVKLR